MKTIQELYDEVMASDELKAELVRVASDGKQEQLEAFLKAHGCGATLEEVAAFLKAKSEEDAPLSLNELDNAAGGECNKNTRNEAIYSTLTFMMGCLVSICVSASGYVAGTMDFAQSAKGAGRLCSAKE